MEEIVTPRIRGRLMMPDLTAETPLIAWNQIGICEWV